MSVPGVRWGLFGGSFDPPHLGHLMVATVAVARAELDRLLVVPCFDHPFGKAMAPWEDRLAMARLAFDPLARVEVSDVEAGLPRPSHTLSTVRALAAAHPEVRWTLVVGSDVMAQRDQWHRFDEVVREADLFVVARAGHPAGAGAPGVPEIPDVNSTDLRERLSRGTDCGTWLDPRVERYLRERGFYGTGR